MTTDIDTSFSAPTTVVLADDHPAIRMGVRLRLEREHGIEIVGEAADGRTAIELVDACHPMIALVDLRMPIMDGLEVTAALAQGDGDTRIVLLTAVTDSHLVQRAMELGASGYVDKESSLDVVVDAIRTVAGGGRFVDPTLLANLLDDGERLSDREVQVLQLAANGMQNKVIASNLQLSEETVKSHISNVIRKLGANSRTEAVASALRRSLIQ